MRFKKMNVDNEVCRVREQPVLEIEVLSWMLKQENWRRGRKAAENAIKRSRGCRCSECVERDDPKPKAKVRRVHDT